MEEEKWLPIPEYEEKYHISDIGRVKSLNYRHTRKELILSPGKSDKYGHLFVLLYKDGKGHYKKVHQLVAQSFIPNPENKPFIDHIDGNPMNNCVWNLKWCTHKENMNNPITREKLSDIYFSEERRKKISDANKGHKNAMYGKHHSDETKQKISDAHTKKSVVQLYKDKIIKIYNSLIAVEKDGFHVGAVCKCCQGKQKSHKGFNWMYLSDEKRQG